MEASDTALISRVLLDDDRHAFSTLVRRHQSKVRGLLRRLTDGNEALADDLAQETFLKTYRALASFRGGSRFSTWLHRIAYNVFISYKRSERTTDEYEDNVVEHSTTDGDLRGPNLQHDLEIAMKKLTEPERTAIRICCQCGFSHSEAAEILRLPLGTIKTNINRGKEKLRRALSAWQESVV